MAVLPVPITCQCDSFSHLTVSALEHAAAIDYRDLSVSCRPIACTCDNLTCNNTDEVGELEYSVECHFSCTCYVLCAYARYFLYIYLLSDWFVIFVISYLEALFGVASILSVLAVFSSI